MELLLAAKKTCAALGWDVFGDAATAPAAPPSGSGAGGPQGALETKTDESNRSYVEDREGPALVSMMMLSEGEVLRNMRLGYKPVASQFHRCHTFAADVCLRAGKWYYEVTIHGPAMDLSNGNLSASIGWITPSFSATNTSHVGCDPQGNSWGCLTGTNFCHRGSYQPMSAFTVQSGAAAKMQAAKKLAAQKKAQMANAGPGSSPTLFRRGRVIGCYVDLDEGYMSWRFDGMDQ
ncbi:unnamed protein product, partial [Symbiodinium sp. KB8]